MPYFYSRKRPVYTLLKNTCGKSNCKCEYEDKNKSMETVIKRNVCYKEIEVFDC